MSRKKSLPKLAASGSQVAELIKVADLSDFNALPCLDEDKLRNLALRLNTALDEYKKDIISIEAARQSRSSNPDTHYEKDILEASDELVRRIENAPPFISSHSRFVALTEDLQILDEWIARIRTDPLLEELAAMDPYLLTPKDRRLRLIMEVYDLYRHFSGRKDWGSRTHSRIPSQDDRPKPFFLLVDICLAKATGRPLSRSLVEKDIAKARKLYRAQKSRS